MCVIGIRSLGYGIHGSGAGKLLVIPEETGIPLTNNGKSAMVLVPPWSLMTNLTTLMVPVPELTAGPRKWFRSVD